MLACSTAAQTKPVFASLRVKTGLANFVSDELEVTLGLEEVASADVEDGVVVSDEVAAVDEPAVEDTGVEDEVLCPPQPAKIITAARAKAAK